MCTSKVEFWYVYLSTKQSELKAIYFAYSDTYKWVVLLALISLFVRLKKVLIQSQTADRFYDSKKPTIGQTTPNPPPPPSETT